MHPGDVADPDQDQSADESTQPAADVGLHRNAPHPHRTCLYGLVGELACAGGEGTETNPYAIAANFMAYLSCAIGRGVYLPIGNTWHHPGFFACTSADLAVAARAMRCSWSCVSTRLCVTWTMG